MRDLCRLLWCALIGLFRSRASLEAEILVLRHQLNVLRRKSPKRVVFTDVDRLLFAGLLLRHPYLPARRPGAEATVGTAKCCARSARGSLLPGGIIRKTGFGRGDRPSLEDLPRSKVRSPIQLATKSTKVLIASDANRCCVGRFRG